VVSDQEREELSEETSEETSEEEAMSADPGEVVEEDSDAEPEEQPPRYRPLSGY
jgi:hypothetical protein